MTLLHQHGRRHSSGGEDSDVKYAKSVVAAACDGVKVRQAASYNSEMKSKGVIENSQYFYNIQSIQRRSACICM